MSNDSSMSYDTRNNGPHKRNSRKLNKEEEVELRRSRGELSCTECKRLKLKCDKVLNACPSNIEWMLLLKVNSNSLADHVFAEVTQICVLMVL